MELPTPEDLKQRRKSDEIDLTQAELADAADVSQPLIARIEGGDVDPRLSTLRRIVQALDEEETGVTRAADLMTEGVATIAPDDSVQEAEDRMDEAGFSQLPVVRDESPEGLISHTAIREASSETDSPVGELPVSEVMDESISQKGLDATLDEIDSSLDHNKAVMVVSKGKLQGLITEADIAAQVS